MTGLPSFRLPTSSMICALILLASLAVLAEASSQKTCGYGGHLYYPGLVDLEPCVTCLCDGLTGDFRCSYKQCPARDDPTCIRYVTAPGECCAACLEHGCNFQGHGYPHGARIPAGPCSYCYCPWRGSSGGLPVCMEVACRNVTCGVDTETAAADGVETEGAYVPPGKCCPVCPSEKR